MSIPDMRGDGTFGCLTFLIIGIVFTIMSSIEIVAWII